MRETRKYKKTCKSCNKYQKPECIARYSKYESDGLGIEAICDNYKRAGGRNIKKDEAIPAAGPATSTEIKCKEEGCKYYDVKLKTGCTRGDDPDNCGHYEFLPTELRSPGKHSEKNLSGIPNMKLEKKKDKKQLSYSISRDATLSDLVQILQLLLKDTGIEIVLRPLK